MSDLETLKEMFEGAGLDYSISENIYSGASISVERGYAGFVCVFDFDKDGNLVDLGAYE